jgi:hypothetical protein
MAYRPNTHIRNSNAIEIEIYTEHISKSGTGRGDQGRRKRKDGKQKGSASHLCRNRTQENTLETVKQHRMGERVRKSSGGGLHQLKHNSCAGNTKAKIPLNNEQTPKQQRTRMKNRSC